jgi:hypothetical protein
MRCGDGREKRFSVSVREFARLTPSKMRGFNAFRFTIAFRRLELREIRQIDRESECFDTQGMVRRHCGCDCNPKATRFAKSSSVQAQSFDDLSCLGSLCHYCPVLLDGNRGCNQKMCRIWDGLEIFDLVAYGATVDQVFVGRAFLGMSRTWMKVIEMKSARHPSFAK